MTPLQEHLIQPHLLSTGGLFQRKLWVGRSNWTGWICWRKHVLKRMASFKILFNNKQEAHLKFPPCPPAWNSWATQGGSSQGRGQIHPWSTASARRQGSPPRTWVSAQIQISPKKFPQKPEDSLVAHRGGRVSRLPGELARFDQHSSAEHQCQPHIFTSSVYLTCFTRGFVHFWSESRKITCEITGSVWAVGESVGDWAREGRREQCVRRDRLGILPKPLLLLHNPRDRPRF